MGLDDLANTGLALSLGGFQSIDHPKKPTVTNPPEKECLNIKPSLTLSLSAGEPYKKASEEEVEEKKVISNEQDPLNHLYRQDSAASSFSNMSVKRERENNGYGTGEEVDEEDGFNSKKKLRLTKTQSAMLEESFKHRTTLTPKQKQELASELNLRPRQVEVWFQNRRARTKLKQTEVDCEFLKKCCETLRDENRRLQKEVQELKALKAANPYCMQLPSAAALTMCPSCERIVGVGENSTSKIPFAVTAAATKPHLFNPFANQSAAC